MRSSSAVFSEAIETAGEGGGWPASPAARLDRPLDLVHLTRQTFGDKRLETELLRLFVRQAAQIDHALEVGPERVDGQGDLDLLHLLVGSARAVGATRVASLAGEAEARLRRGIGAPGGRIGEAERRDLRQAIAGATTYIAELLDQG
ncbi:MAG TPA: Hpt domain-containing protein [Lichenihabitans sp.]|jgi:HPt (histidine-containing phosphotransfer) domain-containing protein|nr:Hpt domain-containing protein [Lichenihabitans sp.]